MNNEETLNAWWHSLPLENQLYAMERLGGGVGSGAPSGCAAAKRGPTSGAEEEERSDEPQSAAVAPGEVAEALALAIDELSRMATVFTEVADEEEEYWTESKIEGFRLESAKMAKSAKILQSLLPQPDSEGSDSELRGRRNAGAVARQPGANSTEEIKA